MYLNKTLTLLVGCQKWHLAYKNYRFAKLQRYAWTSLQPSSNADTSRIWVLK